MSNDFIQNAVNALYQSNELMALKGELANLKAERDQLKADLEKSDGVVWTLSVENDRLKQSLRLQIEQNALAQVGFKMYQDNVDSGGLHKDRKDAIARLEAENARLKAEVERLTELFRKTERLMLLDGEYEATKVGTYARLQAQVERLTADLNKMTKTPEGVDYVEVDVGFWTKSGSRLPSSYSTFWSNDKGVQS